MKKRFTDINIWDKVWFMELEPPEKCAIMFIKDKCDNVGVWDVNKKLAETYIGSKVDWEKIVESSNGNIQILNNNKWWIPDFCFFQYGVLNEFNFKNKPHQSYVALLKKHSLWQDYRKTIERLKDKDKDKETAKDIDTDKDLSEKSQKKKL